MDEETIPEHRESLTDAEGLNRTFTQACELWFTPEIERRKAAGSLPPDFALYMAQALFPPEGQPRVLLNDEINGTALMRAIRNVQKGEQVYVTDLQHVESFELSDELLDNGHFTMFRSGDGWRCFFNFLSGRAKARGMLELAAQFAEAAQFARGKSHAGPAIDNLFSACELISKAELMIHRMMPAESKSHGPIASGINRWAHLGNIDAAFVRLFNRLANQRPSARYGKKEDRPPIPEEEDFDLVGAMIERVVERVRDPTERASKGATRPPSAASP